MATPTIRRVGAINYIASGERSHYFKHHLGLVHKGTSERPYKALHLDGCDCGSGRVVMSKKEYLENCIAKRGGRHSLPDSVTKSTLGRLVAWPKNPNDPLVCISAAGIINDELDSDIAVKGQEKRCACWEHTEDYNFSHLQYSFLIFAETPHPKQFDSPTNALVNNEVKQIDPNFVPPNDFKLQDSKGIKYAIFEHDIQGDSYNIGSAWRYIKFSENSAPVIDENELHLLIMEKTGAQNAFESQIKKSNDPIKKPLRFMLRKYSAEPWLTMDGREYIPLLFVQKDANPTGKVALDFDSFVQVIESNYIAKQSNSSHSGITQKQIDCTLFHDRAKKNHYSPSNPLLENHPFWLQVTYSHGYHESLSKGDKISISVMETDGTEINKLQHELTIDDDDTIQVWIKNSAGLPAGTYQLVVKATSGNSFLGQGRVVGFIVEGAVT